MSLCKWKLKNPPPDNCLAAKDPTEYCEQNVFNSKADMQSSMLHLFYGDFYVIGRVWIDTMKFILVGAELGLFPVVHADVEKVPEKPPKLKYKDLPVYESPHYEYKDYVEKKEKCEEFNIKIAQTALLPTVKEYRTSIQKMYKDILTELISTKDEISTDLRSNFSNFKQYMRDPDNDPLRPATVFAGGLLGYALTKKKYVYKRVIATTIGALAGGFLCYPEATDRLLRNFIFQATKTLIHIFNVFNDKNLSLREYEDCSIEKLPPHVPPPPPPTTKVCKEREKKKKTEA